MTQAVWQYEALWQSLAARRRRRRSPPTGLDARAAGWLARLGQARRGVRYWLRVAEQAERQAASLGDAELEDRIAACRATVRRQLDEAQLVTALALLRAVAQHALGQQPRRLQLAAAAALCHGQFVQLPGGAGRTLAVALAAVLTAWTGTPVHVVVAGAHLARRDAQAMAPLLTAAGLSSAPVLPGHDPARRAASYRCAVVYATQGQLLGDWLRDQLRLAHTRDAAAERLSAPSGRSAVDPAGADEPDLLVPGLGAALVDDADIVLIDNCVQPMAVSSTRRPCPTPQIYRRAAALADALEPGDHFIMGREGRRMRLTESGRQRLAELVVAGGDERWPWQAPRRRRELVEHALLARDGFERGRTHDVVEQRLVPLDGTDGRQRRGAQWQPGVHQALEAREGLEITEDARCLSSLSYQRFFRSYRRLSGTGATLYDIRSELVQTYGAVVRRLGAPARDPGALRCFVDASARAAAAVAAARDAHAAGRPVLLCAGSSAAARELVAGLQDAGVPAQLLDGSDPGRDAARLGSAGRAGLVTVLSGPTGQGTDIRVDSAADRAGGLAVIVADTPSSRRAARELIGRCARRGEAGTAQVFFTLDDSVVAGHPGRVVNWARRVYAGRRPELPGLLARRLYRRVQRLAEASAKARRRSTFGRDDRLDQVVPLR